jgi:hypothetical protein
MAGSISFDKIHSAMDESSKPYGELLKIAGSIGATEFAVFSIEDGATTLRTLCHVRPDQADSKQRTAAIEAFQKIIRPCLEQRKDGAIEILENGRLPSTSPQYCFVLLARETGKIIGAATFILRCEDRESAQNVLKRIQTGNTWSY